MSEKINLASTQPDPNNFLKIVETNAPKPLNSGDAPQSGQPTTPSLALGDSANTGLEKSNQTRIHICDVVNEVNKDIAELQSSVSGVVAQIRTAIQALFAGLATNPFSENIQQQIASLKTEAKLIQKDILIQINHVQAIQTYVTYLKKLIDVIENSSAELQALLTSCLEGANADLKVYSNQLQTLGNNTALNEKIATLNKTNEAIANTA